MNLLRQYQGLRKENYILFLGRMVTNMGAMVWPILTLILNQKMGLSASMVALTDIISGALFIPAGLIGGKIADRFNKKMCIVYCDLCSIVLYLICGFIPLSFFSIGLFMLAATFQHMEHPAYTALIADITETKDRERAYSLSYLGANLGLVASPTIAGILFKNYLWLIFVISGLAIGVSTLLIFVFVKDITPVEEDDKQSSYQESKADVSMLQVLRENKIILLFLLIWGLQGGAYQQFGFLMPLDLGRIHGENGAVIYGSVTSMNCIVVCIFTPIFTTLFAKVTQTQKILVGQSFLLFGFIVFLTMLGFIPSYYLAITLFTFGEIFLTLSCGPYLSDRVPSSHRGRINGLQTIMQNVAAGACMYLCGLVFEHLGSTAAWEMVFGLLGVSLFASVMLIILDKKRYPDLYES